MRGRVNYSTVIASGAKQSRKNNPRVWIASAKPRNDETRIASAINAFAQYYKKFLQ